MSNKRNIKLNYFIVLIIELAAKAKKVIMSITKRSGKHSKSKWSDIKKNYFCQSKEKPTSTSP